MPLDRPAILGGDPVNPNGPPEWPFVDPSVSAAVVAAMADGSWGRYLGPHGDRLRETLATYHGVRHVHLCASGTAAVELALRGLGVGPGDEVILAAYDFEANFKNVLALGATPVLVDVRPDDIQIDLGRIEEAASERVKAVLVSHLHGGVVDMPRLREIASRRGWGVIEDACQMPGAVVYGRRAGTWGDAGVLSFGGSKLLTAGRGGCVLTDRDDLLQRIRLHVQRGNDLSPLSELQAAALLPQLVRLDERNATRTTNAARLRTMLDDVPGLRMFSAASEGRQSPGNAKSEIRNPKSETNPKPEIGNDPAAGRLGHSRFELVSDFGFRASGFPSGQGADAPRSPMIPGYYKLAFWYDPAAFDGLSRDLFAAAVRAEGIALWPGFRSLHRVHSRRRFRSVGGLPNADDADERLLVLHHPVLLGSENDVEQIAVAIRKVRRFASEVRDAAIPPA